MSVWKINGLNAFRNELCEGTLEHPSAIRWPSPLSFPDEAVEEGYQRYSAASFFKLSLVQHLLGLTIIGVLLYAHVTGFSHRAVFTNSNYSVALTVASFLVHAGCVVLMLGWPSLYLRSGVWEALTALSRVCIIAAGRDLYTCPECQAGVGSLSSARAFMNGSYCVLTFFMTVGEPLPFTLHVIVQVALLCLTMSGNAHMCGVLSTEPKIMEELQKAASSLLPSVHRILWYPVAPPHLIPDYLAVSPAISCQALLATAQLLWQAMCVGLSFYWEVSLRKAYLQWKFPNDRRVKKWPFGFPRLLTLCIAEFPVILFWGVASCGT
jgi:hypothetical protein